MRVVHINTNDGDDGVGRAAFRLHIGLRKLGVESYMFVQRSSSGDAYVIRYEYPRTLNSHLVRRLMQWRIQLDAAPYRMSRPQGYERFSDDRGIHRREVLQQIPQGDVYHLHSIADFIDYKTFFRGVPKEIPIVWTLHDMEPFTGGCHYDFGCGRFTSGCGACPQLGSSSSHDLSRQVWRRKEEVFSQIPAHRLHIVALNRWMAEQVANSPLLGHFPLQIIPNGVNTDDFAPRPKIFARKVLGIPPEKRVLLYVSGSMKTRRKGFHLLAQALSTIQSHNHLFLLSLGGGFPNLKVPIPHQHIHSLHNDRLLSLVYSAADIFVLPSMQDNLPNTVLEAMACGIPVVAFDVGGVSSAIIPGKTGLLVPPANVTAFGASLVQLLEDNPLREKMSACCRNTVLKDFAINVRASQYLSLYEQVGG